EGDFMALHQLAWSTAHAPASALFTHWLASSGLSGEDALADSDPDGDGIANLLEYALGGNPTYADRSILPLAGIEQVGDAAFLTLQFERTADPLLNYGVRGGDFGVWEP
ncbi:hypothetical protein RZS08_47285, partial [Arthrospira platensis SPKY1]|nr:hypothetical protein [Arthrospira platensis SPKY1]